MKKILAIIAFLLSLLLGSCGGQDPLSSEEAIEEDVSGKPNYHGLANDDLDFSLIPLVEGNWWKYEVRYENYTTTGSGDFEKSLWGKENYTVTCGKDYEQEGYRWFRMSSDMEMAIQTPTLYFNNSIRALSNREEGLYRKYSEDMQPDGLGNTSTVTGLWVPYFEDNDAHIPNVPSDGTDLIVEGGLNYKSPGGVNYSGLIRYRYRINLGGFIESSGEMIEGLYAYNDYYFKEGLGLVAFVNDYNVQDLPINIWSEMDGEFVPFGPIMSVHLIDSHIIEL